MKSLNEMLAEHKTLKAQWRDTWQRFLSAGREADALAIDRMDGEAARLLRRINEALEQVYFAYLSLHNLAALHEGNDGGPLSDACDAALAAYEGYRKLAGLQPGDIKVR